MRVVGRQVALVVLRRVRGRAEQTDQRVAPAGQIILDQDRTGKETLHKTLLLFKLQIKWITIYIYPRSTK